MFVKTWLLDEKTGNKLYEQERKTELTYEEVKKKYYDLGYSDFGKSYEGIDLLLYKPINWNRTGFAALIKGD